MKPREGRFSGADYQPELDESRLRGQIKRIFNVLRVSGWVTVDEIRKTILRELDIDDPATSISAQIRNLRKDSFGGFVVHRRRRGNNNKGLYEFKLSRPITESAERGAALSDDGQGLLFDAGTPRVKRNDYDY